MRTTAVTLLGSTLVLSLACSKTDGAPQRSDLQITAPEVKPPEGPPVEIDPALLAAMQPPLPKSFGVDNPALVELGHQLYFETRLSKNHDLSCNSCHGLDTYGVDRKPVSDGHRGQKGARNSPTVYNAAGHFVQFWDGRAKDVEAQATGPVLNPVEMAMPDEKRVVATLESIPEYVAAFKKAFPKEAKALSLKNVGVAIGAYERQLVTPSRWDRFLAGDQQALSNEEKRGFKTFQESGCVACHSGSLVGGGSFQKVGAVKPWPNQTDEGRFAETKAEADKMLFKVPSLRNVAETAPYFHDGSVASLEQAITMMGEHQLGRSISASDAASIATWLRALTGELPDATLIAPPTLPPSTDKTPKPDAT